ncbi:MAG: sigma 54-interacting transcriptional regulator [Pelosinus sp.]|nr:sigma 54-interacting transcriptional regulator [Pelosinus sp.]
MIRERRNKEKLENYYHKFINQGVIDPNVHPWVAESWQRSRDFGVASERLGTLPKLSKDDIAWRREQHKGAIGYLDGYYEEIREYFNTHNITLLLLDADCHVLKCYDMPFYQKTAGELVGARLAEQDIGTSSISIAQAHHTPFLLFGPEVWLAEHQFGDACSAPIMIDGQMRYIVSFIAVEQDSLPFDSVVALLLSMKYSMENHLRTMQQLSAKQVILDAVPFAVYHVMPGGEVVYTNKLGQSRLEGIDAAGPEVLYPSLSDAVLNYRHTPIYKGFLGIPSYNKEVTWITARKTYEDITTVVPLFENKQQDDKDVGSVVAVSLPIEDLRTMVAHAVGYTARYSLSSLVGKSSAFTAMKDKAARVAKSGHHVLLQGDPGSGKQRLAHSIHQASSRAAGPLISVKCGDVPPELLENELFGVTKSQDESRPGKLELANNGTLFLDEVEKLPIKVATRLAEALEKGRLNRLGEMVERSFDVRIIAACDSDLKRLTEKGSFHGKLYEYITKAVIRIPALRARREDIPLLAEHMIEELAAQHRIHTKKILPETAEILMNYDWRGSIKQLQGVVEQAFFNTAADEITPDDISLINEVSPGNTAWKENREVFIELWRSAGGNISRLANMLDVSRVTLYRYLKKYGLDKE